MREGENILEAILPWEQIVALSRRVDGVDGGHAKPGLVYICHSSDLPRRDVAPGRSAHRIRFSDWKGYPEDSSRFFKWVSVSGEILEACRLGDDKWALTFEGLPSGSCEPSEYLVHFAYVEGCHGFRIISLEDRDGVLSALASAIEVAMKNYCFEEAESLVKFAERLSDEEVLQEMLASF